MAQGLRDIVHNPHGTKVYFKMRQVFYYKVQRFYYKMQQVLQYAMIFLENATFTTKCNLMSFARSILKLHFH